LLLFGFNFFADCQTAPNCMDFSTILPGKVHFPGSTEYEASVASYFFLNERLQPACVVSPSSVEEVASIVQKIAASPSNTTFSIRSGGHAPNVGAANARGGVTIDLRELNAVSVSQDGTTVSIGGGARWEQVYPILDPQNLGVVGARISNVGVGGFITGGRRVLYALRRKRLT
jgi:FAD/FMN-containing dehydrogenase